VDRLGGTVRGGWRVEGGGMGSDGNLHLDLDWRGVGRDVRGQSCVCRWVAVSTFNLECRESMKLSRFCSLSESEEPRGKTGPSTRNFHGVCRLQVGLSDRTWAENKSPRENQEKPAKRLRLWFMIHLSILLIRT
jgi:hypothetical protein